MKKYIFHDNVWKLHPGELPVKPRKESYDYISAWHEALSEWDLAISDIKKNALVIENFDILKAMSHPEQNAFTLMYDGQAYISEGEFHEWPGEFERKKKVEFGNYGYKIAILILPREEKNMKTDNWISVKDKTKVPKEYQICLVWNTANNEGWEIQIQGFIPPRFTSKVTHWMPLPEPPQR